MHGMNSSISISNALGHGPADKRMEILRLIGQTGSISQAARTAQVSYKAAWQAIDTLTNLAGVGLVEKVVGGAGGGGAKLTEAGQRLLDTAALLERVRDEILTQLQVGGTEHANVPLSQLAIRTSMRNQLPCRVCGLEGTGQIVRVILQLPGGEALVSRITRASAELLALAEGQTVLALFKATAVTVVRQAELPPDTGGNVLPGRVARIARGADEDELVVALQAGLQVVGFCAGGSKLRPGSPVAAVVDESAVVLSLA